MNVQNMYSRSQVSDYEKEQLIIKLTKALQLQNQRVKELRNIQHSSLYLFCC